MKHLKLFEQKSYEEKVAKICRKYGIENWSISSEGLVNVIGDVNLEDKNLTKLPLNFGHVSSYFDCRHNKLTSLEGAPKSVGGDFNCYYNNLASLEGCPQSVGGKFNCPYNKLTSLEGGPQEVGGDFYCYMNRLTSLEGAPLTVGGNFNCYNNQLTSLEGAPLTVGGNFNCQDNKLTSLRFAPEEVEGWVFVLPNPIADIPEQYLFGEYLQFIVKEQYDWRLYRKDGSIYPERLKQMIEWGIETNKIKPL